MCKPPLHVTYLLLCVFQREQASRQDHTHQGRGWTVTVACREGAHKHYLLWCITSVWLQVDIIISEWMVCSVYTYTYACVCTDTGTHFCLHCLPQTLFVPAMGHWVEALNFWQSGDRGQWPACYACYACCVCIAWSVCVGSSVVDL